MKKSTISSAVLVVLILSASFALDLFAGEPAHFDKQAAQRNHGAPLKNYLNPDGTLCLPAEGVPGSIDPAGYRLVSSPGEPPRFAAAESGPKPSAAGDENWDSRFTMRGVDGEVYALAWDGTNLYAGGQFTIAGGAAAENIAKWDGSAWSAMGTDGINNPVNALVWGGGNLYAGGNFTIVGGVTVNSVAKWNGSSWSALGTGMGPEATGVYALAWDGANLYAGGDFTTAGGVPANYVAKWDGMVWSALDTGMGGYGTIYALVWGGGNLYAGGHFGSAGELYVSNIAKWDGTSWSALGTGTDYDVKALAWDGVNLYAGGWFMTAGEVPVEQIAKWNGSEWSALGTGMGPDYPEGSPVLALAWDGSNLYAGGNFTTAGGVAANNIAKWDGSTWSALGTGIDFMGEIPALACCDGNLYSGGMFSTAGG